MILTNMTQCEKILKLHLSKDIKKYSVIKFCEDAKMTRNVFYHYYDNICDLFGAVIAFQIRKTLKQYHNETLGQMFYRMLTEIRANRIFYTNIIRISKDNRVYYDIVRKEFANAISDYLQPQSRFSPRRVELAANGIYAISENWLVHECKHDIRDVYQCIDLLLQQVEK